nr:hypothetical protein CFP56_03115 [Quercus suber]
MLRLRGRFAVPPDESTALPWPHTKDDYVEASTSSEEGYPFRPVGSDRGRYVMQRVPGNVCWPLPSFQRIAVVLGYPCDRAFHSETLACNIDILASLHLSYHRRINSFSDTTARTSS